MFLFEADVLDNAKVFTRAPYSIMQNLLTLVSIIQLTSVHISRDKHLTILLTNQPNSKLEVVVKWESEDFSQNLIAKEKNVFKIDCSLLHLLEFNDPHPKQLHKWEFSSKYSTFKDSKTSKVMVSLNRKTQSGDKWKVSYLYKHFSAVISSTMAVWKFLAVSISVMPNLFLLLNSIKPSPRSLATMLFLSVNVSNLSAFSDRDS